MILGDPECVCVSLF